MHWVFSNIHVSWTSNASEQQSLGMGSCRLGPCCQCASWLCSYPHVSSRPLHPQCSSCVPFSKLCVGSHDRDFRSVFHAFGDGESHAGAFFFSIFTTTSFGSFLLVPRPCEARLPQPSVLAPPVRPSHAPCFSHGRGARVGEVSSAHGACSAANAMDVRFSTVRWRLRMNASGVPSRSAFPIERGSPPVGKGKTSGFERGNPWTGSGWDEETPRSKILGH
eukprot:scaffold131_cov335-Pavlova_lutheri.AAC.35